MDGILLLDKARGETSHDAVARVRRESGERRAGHAGTLDPGATGLLVICLGRALKLLEFMTGHDKEYVTDVRLGRSTDTDDADGRVIAEADPSGVTREGILAAVARLTGDLRQTPPQYAAVRVAGKRLYEYARAGESAPAPERHVRVDAFELLDLRLPLARFRIRCSKGTYVRSLARDLGRALSCGASVEMLRRTASGPFRVEQAVAAFDAASLLSLDAGVAHLPSLTVDDEAAGHFEHGRSAPVAAAPGIARVYVGLRLLGIGAVRDGRLLPKKVLGMG